MILQVKSENAMKILIKSWLCINIHQNELCDVQQTHDDMCSILSSSLPDIFMVIWRYNSKDN